MNILEELFIPGVTVYAEGETGTMTQEQADALAQSEGGAQSTQVGNAGGLLGGITMFLPMILIIVLMYFMMIRPQRKKEKETKAMIDALKVGDKVVTIGGICGKVEKIKDEYVILETGNIGSTGEKSYVKMERDSIKTVEKKESV